jgi:hypothetical protein
LENRRIEQVVFGELVPVGGGGCEKVCRKWILCKHCVQMWISGKMRHVETIPGMGGRGDKGEWWKGEFN